MEFVLVVGRIVAIQQESELVGASVDFDSPGSQSRNGDGAHILSYTLLSSASEKFVPLRS